MASLEHAQADDRRIERVRSELSGRRVAVVHDWITGLRGGEKVLEAIFDLVPAADLFTLVYLPGSTSPTIEQRRITAAWTSRLPRVGRYYRWLLPFFPGAVESLDLSGYDLVVSSSHCVAKGARAPAGSPHLCYCHTPMRYVWDRFDDYFGHLPAPLAALIRIEARLLRRWDRDSAGRVDGWMANSSFVSRRIIELYGVAPERVAVLHPPVDVDRFAVATAEPTDRYLVVSALVPYKRIDHAVEACARSGRYLDVAGRGPERRRLEALVAKLGAGNRVRLLGFVPDDDLPALFASHRAMLLPGVEDFGITPVEALAAGRPVIAVGEGGVLDSVEDGRTGVLYRRASVDGLIDALDRFESGGGGWDPSVLRESARRFAPERFRAGLAERLAAHGFRGS